MACAICAGAMEYCFTAEVLCKYPAQYEWCRTCGYLRVREPHWLDEAYSSSIAAADTGLVARNLSRAFQLAAALYWIVGERGTGRYLDAAGGYGMLTRLMRDIGFDFYWADKYSPNLLAQGFEYALSRGPCRAVTAVEVFEHLPDPTAFLAEIVSLSGASTLLFTTELFQGRPPDPQAWWYYSFATGQHIGFFQRSTLETMAKKVGLRFATANGLHVFSREPVNEMLLRLATGRLAAFVGSFWIRHHLGTKTISDHELMLRRALEVDAHLSGRQE